MFEGITELIGSLVESITDKLKEIFSKLKGLLYPEPVGEVDTDDGMSPVYAAGRAEDISLSVGGSANDIVGLTDDQVVVDSFDYTFTLSKGSTVTEETRLMGEPQKWIVEDIHREDGGVVAYTFRVEEGNHKEIRESDTVQQMIGDGTLSVSAEMSNGSSIGFHPSKTYSGSFSFST